MRPHRRTPAALAALIGAALVLSGCSSAGDAPAAAGSPSAEAADAAEPRVVQTDQGEVTVPADPQRVVVLNYALAGYLYDLDVPVLATIPESADGEGVYSEMWAEDAEADGTEFLPWSTDGFDLEAVLALEPDLIVAGGIGFPLFQATQAYDQLAQIAPTVIVSGTLTDWRGQFGFLADDVFGKAGVYEEAVAAYEERVAEVRDAITPPAGPVTYVSITADGTPYVLIEDQGLPEDLAAVGLEPAPVFAEGGFEPYTAGGDMFELSTEQVGQVLTQPTLFVLGFNGDTTDVATLEQNPVWAALPSFAAGQAFDLPYWSLRGDYDEALALLDIVEEQFS